MLHVCECCAVIAAVLRVITKSLKLRYSLCLLVVATVSRNTICMSKQSVVYVPGWNVLMDYSLRLQISHPSPDGKIILSEMIKNLKKEKNLKKKKKKRLHDEFVNVPHWNYSFSADFCREQLLILFRHYADGWRAAVLFHLDLVFILMTVVKSQKTQKIQTWWVS